MVRLRSVLWSRALSNRFLPNGFVRVPSSAATTPRYGPFPEHPDPVRGSSARLAHGPARTIPGRLLISCQRDGR